MHSLYISIYLFLINNILVKKHHPENRWPSRLSFSNIVWGFHLQKNPTLPLRPSLYLHPYLCISRNSLFIRYNKKKNSHQKTPLTTLCPFYFCLIKFMTLYTKPRNFVVNWLFGVTFSEKGSRFCKGVVSFIFIPYEEVYPSLEPQFVKVLLVFSP
jgi:hypothetical protein